MKHCLSILFNSWGKNFSNFLVNVRATRFFDWVERNEFVYQLLKSLYRFIRRPLKTLPEIAFNYKLLKSVPERTIYCDISGIYNVPFLDGTRRVGKYFADHLFNMHDVNWRVIHVGWVGNTYVDVRKSSKTFNVLIRRRFEWNPNQRDILFLQTMEAVTQIGPTKFKKIKDRITVVTFIHDVLPIREPGWFTNRMVNSFIRDLDLALENSRVLIVSSKVVEGDLEALTTAGEHRANIPQIARVNIASVAQRFISQQKNREIPTASNPLVFLLISTIEPRKGYDELITAASQALLAGVNLKFIIVGRLGWVSEIFRSDFNEFVQAFTDEIQWHENATDEEISKYVSEADIFLSPTRGEGFGIPVTEALNAGLPTLVRDIPVYQELYSGVVAMYGEGNDFSDLHGALMNTEKLYEIASARISKYKPGGDLDSLHSLMEVFRSH